MLTEFKVENYGNIERCKLNLNTAEDFAKTAMIYGVNGSGKSTLLNVIYDIKRLFYALDDNIKRTTQYTLDYNFLIHNAYVRYKYTKLKKYRMEEELLMIDGDIIFDYTAEGKDPYVHDSLRDEKGNILFKKTR